MNAFTRAASVLAANADVTQEVVWRDRPESPGITIRAAVSQPGDELNMLGQRVAVQQWRADILISDVPDIAAGHTIEIDGAEHPVRDEPQKDAMGLFWILKLGPQET